MSRMDWDVMVADLEEKRTAAAQEVSDIDAVIAAVRQRANGAATPAPKLKAVAPAHKNGRAKAKPTTNGGRTKLDPALLARVRKQYEAGVPIAQIPEGKGHSSNWIYQLASVGRWKRPEKKAARPNPGVAASPAAAAPVQQPAGTQLSGSVKCTDPECGVMTDYDPCRRCGKKLKRKGW